MRTNEALLRAEALFLASVEENRFLPLLKRGAIVALSGGADSILLLLLAKRLALRESFPLYAIHVHHGIRGEAADRDEALSRRIAEEHEIPFLLHTCDAVRFAKQEKMGLEEAARTLRYRAFTEASDDKGGLPVLTAHHAGDNAETFLLNLLRGSGLNGLCGIPPRRGIFLRPMLSIAKSEIMEALREVSTPYAEDESNGDTAYRRNYIRHEIMPRLSYLSPHPERSIERAIRALKGDDDFLKQEADRVYGRLFSRGRLPRREFAELHDAIAVRVLKRFVAEGVGFSSLPSATQSEKMISLARFGDTDFRVDLPSGAALVGDRDTLFVETKTALRSVYEDAVYFLKSPADFSPDGEMYFRFLSLEEKKTEKPEEFLVLHQNVYKLLKQIRLSHDTMVNGIHIRHRKSGDRYRYGGQTHKVATLLSDRKLSKCEKDLLWILCDRSGILWLPEGSVRDGEGHDGGCLLCYARMPAEQDSSIGDKVCADRKV